MRNNFINYFGESLIRHIPQRHCCLVAGAHGAREITPVGYLNRNSFGKRKSAGGPAVFLPRFLRVKKKRITVKGFGHKRIY